MKYLLIITTMLSGCTDNLQERIICDSGYKTPWSEWANINEGIIMYTIQWKPNISWVRRKMKEGEVCYTEKRAAK